MIYFHYSTDDNRIFVSSDTKDDRFRYLPGARWLSSKQIWSLPGTPMVAHRAAEAAGIGKVEMTKAFARLLVKGEPLQQLAGEFKEASDLSEPPISNHKKPQWLHQRRAYHFSMPLPAVMLAMDMGTGKTRVVYDVIQNSKNIKTVLVACPKAGIEDAWGTQFKKWWRANDGTQILTLVEGTQLERANRAYDYLCSSAPGRRIIVVNYEILWQPTFGDMALSGNWDLIALDESHRIRSAGGTWSKYLFRLGERAQKRMALSGTPMANGPRDVYGQYRFLDAGIFGTNIARFDEEFVEYADRQHYQIKGYRNQEELNRRFYSIAFWVSDDVLDLPVWHDVYRKTKLESPARKLYDELDKEFTIGIQNETVTADNVLVKATRLAQIVSGKVRIDTKDKKQKIFKEVSRAKRDLLIDVLAGLEKKEPLVIFARFHQDLDVIRHVCDKMGRSAGELSSRRNDLVAWKTSKLDVIAIQIQAGSEVIDLTRSRYCIFYSIDFSRNAYLQARKRVRRPGQKRPVTFIHLLVQATIDIDIMAAIRKKTSFVDYIMNLKRRAT
jgi:SNF2 family DNA or RNA helicase